MSVPIQLMLEQQFPVMIVMNTGSHYQNDNAYRSNMGGALNQIRDWQQLCRDCMHITCPFFWQTTPPGPPQLHDLHQASQQHIQDGRTFGIQSHI